MLRGRETLDSGTEKVLLMKLKRVLTAGMDAARIAELQVRGKALRAAGAGLKRPSAGRDGVSRLRQHTGADRGVEGICRLCRLCSAECVH